MERKRWYVIAYDIREPGRLQRVHRYLSKTAWMLQRSVYLCQVEPAQLEIIRQELKAITDDRWDDIRAYAVESPAGFWTAGRQGVALEDCYGAGEGKTGIAARLYRKIKKHLGMT